MLKLLIERSRFKTLVEDEDIIDTPEKISAELRKIAKNLGYNYKEASSATLGKGIIYVSNDVKIIIRYNTKINEIYVAIGEKDDRRPLYNCTDVSSNIDDVSVDLQTASMICNEIRQKIRY